MSAHAASYVGRVPPGALSADLGLTIPSLLREGRVCGNMSPSQGGLPMLSRIQPLGSCLIVLALLLFAGSAAAQDVSPRCEAAMDRAAGGYSRCLPSRSLISPI